MSDLLFEFSDSYKSSRKNLHQSANKARFILVKVKGSSYYVQKVGTKTVLPYHKDFLKVVS